jgi:hypothetical protein
LRKTACKLSRLGKDKMNDDQAVYFCKKLLKMPEVARKMGKMIICMGVEQETAN